MGNQPKHLIGAEGFSTLKAIEARAKGIVAKHGPSGGTLNAADFAFMRALLDRHPHAADKIGTGIEAIRVAFVCSGNIYYRHLAFVADRFDGSTVDFGYHKCISDPHPLHDLYQTLRREVADQTIAFRRAFFDGPGPHVCPIVGISLTPENAHVDHVAPLELKTLIEMWFQWRGLDPYAIETTGREDGEDLKRLEDRELASDWKEFHRQRATLRVVSAKANCGDLRSAKHKAEVAAALEEHRKQFGMGAA